MDKETRKKTGIYNKFSVVRTDGQSRPGQKHAGCSYFVLDLVHDYHAIPALRAYSDSCRTEYPVLADDLWNLAEKMAADFG